MISNNHKQRWKWKSTSKIVSGVVTISMFQQKEQMIHICLYLYSGLHCHLLHNQPLPTFKLLDATWRLHEFELACNLEVQNNIVKKKKKKPQPMLKQSIFNTSEIPPPSHTSQSWKLRPIHVTDSLTMKAIWQKESSGSSLHYLKQVTWARKPPDWSMIPLRYPQARQFLCME